MALPMLPPISDRRLAMTRDALRGCSRDAAILELDHEWRALDERRTMRAHRRLVRATPQCGGCYRFLRNPAHECPACGYLDGRGYPG